MIGGWYESPLKGSAIKDEDRFTTLWNTGCYHLGSGTLETPSVNTFGLQMVEFCFYLRFTVSILFFCNSLWGHMNSVLPQHIVIYWQNRIFSKWPLRESCLLLVVRLIQSAPMLALLMLTFFSHRASFPPLLLVLFPLTRSHAPPLVLLYYLPVLSSLYFLRTCN